MDLRSPIARRTAAVLLLLASTAVARAGHAEEQDAAGPACALARQGAVETTTESCVACHRTGSGSSHPFEIDYAQAAYTRPMTRLRPAAEVVKRGVFLVDGKVQCRTCHDPRSPWRYYVALPPGAKLSPAVNPREPSTYEDGPARAALVEDLKLARFGGERLLVSAKPLCLSCHALD